MKATKIFQVSEITELIKEALEENFSSIVVEGEISNCRPASSGHIYFNLKDKDSMLSAVLFKGKSKLLNFEPKDGMLVRVSGSISVYAQRGSYQIICDTIERAGLGEILVMLEERKRRLQEEGLFDEARKKEIPAFPQKIVVITSPTGAAVRDILNIIKRRNSLISVIIIPSLVQGSEAAASITKAIKIANTHNLGDVIIVGRGGGSIEDLLPFSDEALVRAIALSKIPTISAVGHETDWSLCDYAADLRAPTPSAAAELVACDKEDILYTVQSLHTQIRQQMKMLIDQAHLILDRFTDDNLEMKLRKIEQPYLMRFDDAKESLLLEMQKKLIVTKHKLEMNIESLSARNPASILDRGYTIIKTKKTGKVIQRIDQIEKGLEVTINFSKGSADAIMGDIHG